MGETDICIFESFRSSSIHQFLWIPIGSYVSVVDDDNSVTNLLCFCELLSGLDNRAPLVAQVLDELSNRSCTRNIKSSRWLIEE